MKSVEEHRPINSVVLLSFIRILIFRGLGYTNLSSFLCMRFSLSLSSRHMQPDLIFSV